MGYCLLKAIVQNGILNFAFTSESSGIALKS